MIYLILGMHKSGTTLIAKMLHESGIHMGEFDPGLGYDEDNKYERHSTQELNRKLLDGYLIPPLKVLKRRLKDSQYDQAGYRKNSDSLALIRFNALKRKFSVEKAPQIGELIQACSQVHTDWGFKDPRTCLTYPIWKRYLPEHRLIIVYRSYEQLIQRYLKGSRNLTKLFRVLHSWTIHNLAILEYLDTTSVPKIILNYERMMDGNEEYRRLTAFMGRPLVDTRNPGLYRNRSQEKAEQVSVVKFLLPFLPAKPWQVLQTLDIKRMESVADEAQVIAGNDPNE